MKSIRIFLIITLIATITLVIFVATIHGYRESLREAEHLLDAQLVEQVRSLKMMLPLDTSSTLQHQAKQQWNGVEDNPDGGDDGGDDDYGHIIALQLWSNTAQLIRRSENAPTLPITQFNAGFGDVNFKGYRWRTYTHYSSLYDTWFMVAARNDQRYQLTEKVIIESVLPVILSLPFVAIMIWFIVTLGLRPIEILSRKIAKKQASDLSAIEIGTVPGELMSLTNSANDLLRRLDDSFEREKHFNSDVAHELRTPIAALNILISNLMNEVGVPNESVLELKYCVERMSHVVEQILLLNRMTPEQYQSTMAAIDLLESVKKVVANDIGLLNEKDQEISFEGESCEIQGDEFAIQTLIHNLLSNASKYTPAGGQVLIRALHERDGVALEVEDSGPGIPPDQYDRVFNRFYRVGGDRHSSKTMGCGLGLSIVQHIVTLHHARIELGPSIFATGLKVRVFFPYTPSPENRLTPITGTIN